MRVSKRLVRLKQHDQLHPPHLAHSLNNRDYWAVRYVLCREGEVMLRVLDLFSGVGGFSLGLERTGGFRTVAFCEMKPHAQAVLAKNFPGIPCHDDVTTYDFKEGEADVITAGFPCQDISFAGEGAGLAGARSGLYREVIRALRLVRPRFAVLENVAALLSRGLGTVLGDVAAVGYDAEWHCIPASAVGAPHRRDRIWIVANARGEQHEGGSSPLSGTLAAELSRSVADPQSDGQSFGWSGDQGHHDNPQGAILIRAELGGDGAGTQSPDLADTDLINVQGLISSIVDPQGRGGSIKRPARPRGDGLRWWATEPDVGRVAHGVPARVDRLAELGNAVVPQIPGLIGRAILASIQEAA